MLREQEVRVGVSSYWQTREPTIGASASAGSARRCRRGPPAPARGEGAFEPGRGRSRRRARRAPPWHRVRRSRRGRRRVRRSRRTRAFLATSRRCRRNRRPGERCEGRRAAGKAWAARRRTPDDHVCLRLIHGVHRTVSKRTPCLTPSSTSSWVARWCVENTRVGLEEHRGQIVDAE